MNQIFLSGTVERKNEIETRGGTVGLDLSWFGPNIMWCTAEVLYVFNYYLWDLHQDLYAAVMRFDEIH